MDVIEKLRGRLDVEVGSSSAVAHGACPVCVASGNSDYAEHVVHLETESAGFPIAEDDPELGRPVRVWPKREPAPPTLTPLDFATLRLLAHIYSCRNCDMSLGFKIEAWPLCPLGRAFLATVAPLRLLDPEKAAAGAACAEFCLPGQVRRKGEVLCCERAGEQDRGGGELEVPRRLFTCPKSCPCHD